MKLLLLFLIFSVASSEMNGDGGKKKKFRQHLINLIEQFDAAVRSHGDTETLFEIFHNHEKGSEESKPILEKVKVIENELKHMEEPSGFTKEDEMMKKSPSSEKYVEILRTLNLKRHNVYLAWKDIMERYVESPDESINIANKPVKRKSKIGRTEKRELLLQKIVEPHFDKVFEFINMREHLVLPFPLNEIYFKSLPILMAAQTTQETKESCGHGASVQKYLMDLFKQLVKDEVKATVLLILMHRIQLGIQDRSAYRRDIYVDEFKNRYNAYSKEFSKALDIASREFRSCDPKNGWIKGDSYFELDKFHQVTMLRAPRGWWSIPAKERPQRAVDIKNHNSVCENSQGDCYDSSVEICRGNLISCTAISYAKRCVLQNDVRRYRWIEANSPVEVWGSQQDGCVKQDLIQENDYWYCLCDCIDPRNSVSLELSMSNVKKNRVVTAMRFAKENSIIFIQIKEGRLGPNGTIKKQFQKWIPSSPTTDPKKLMVFDSTANTFNTDDLVGRHNDVLTGIGFTRSTEDSGKRLKLQIHVVRFQYSTGRILGRHLNITSSTIAKNRHVVGDISSLYDSSREQHIEDSVPGHYERFYRSSLNSDAGQTTIPLFDSVPVKSNVASPLCGAGLIHKGIRNHAGFLSLKAIGLDYSYFFKKYYGVKSGKSMKRLAT